MLWPNEFPRSVNNINLTRDKEKKASLAGEGLDPSILKEYNITPQSSEEFKGGWLLKDQKKDLWVFKYSGDRNRLLIALEWQENLAKNKCSVLKMKRTKGDKLYLENNKEFFFVTEWISGQKFEVQQERHLLSCFKELGKIHKITENYSNVIIQNTRIDWTLIIQKKLKDLLQYHSFLRGKIKFTDFERFFMEHFDYFYNAGQEAVENMVLLQVDSARPHLLVNNFRSTDLLINDNKVVFTNLLKWSKGPKILDLVLLLNSYMPLLKWNSQAFKNILKTYKEETILTKQDEQVLLALLRFPGRFWFYAYQYFVDFVEEKVLSEKFKKYIREYYWRDQCLNTVETWLWEG